MNINRTEYFNTSFEIGNGETNQDFFTERKFLGGWTVSDRHPIKGFKRKKYQKNIISNSVVDISIDHLRNILEMIVENYATDHNAIFLSGGKDSTTLAHIFRKLDIPFRAISLYSNNSSTSEVPAVKRIAADLEINVEFYHLNIIPTYDFPYWVENPYTAKIMAVKDLGLENYTIFTGEIGTGEMQVNQPLLYTAQRGYRPRDLAHWHVNVCGSHRRINSVKPIYEDDIYKECVEYFHQRLKKWDQHPDVLNRVMFGRLQEEGSYRLFNYSTDKYNWCHPFAENEFIHSCVNMPSELKGSKNLYRQMYPDLTTIPWEYPKSGLGIPAQQ